MSDVAVIGAPELVAGFALGGARVYAVAGAEQARAAWAQLPASVTVVLLSGPAAAALADATTARGAPLAIRLPA
jgi:vacuolar-type H+-ATPase subunit F/Vma7